MTKGKVAAKGKITLPHTCPSCKTATATTHQGLEEEFGFRNMNAHEMRNQSWCRKCRSKK